MASCSADVVDRELVRLAVEVVAAVLNAVRPGDQDLPAARAAHLVLLVAVEQLAAARGVGAEPGARPPPRPPAGRRARSRSGVRTGRSGLCLLLEHGPLVERVQQRQRGQPRRPPRRRRRPAARSASRSTRRPARSSASSGSRYGYCAAPQPQITPTTAPTARTRTPRRAPRHMRSSAAAPHTAEPSTNGRPSSVRPS